MTVAGRFASGTGRVGSRIDDQSGRASGKETNRGKSASNHEVLR
jgi:hypothetical protein